MADLLLKGGRIIDPANGRDEVADIGFADGKVAAIGHDLPREGAVVVEARGLIVVPGLIDLHLARRRCRSGRATERHHHLCRCRQFRPR